VGTFFDYVSRGCTWKGVGKDCRNPLHEAAVAAGSSAQAASSSSSSQGWLHCQGARLVQQQRMTALQCGRMMFA
jgi:hypothetical protein